MIKNKMSEYMMKKIYEQFLEIVEKYNLLDLEIEGVKVWQYSQFQIFNSVLVKLGIFDHAHSSTNKFQKVSSIPMMIYNSVLKNPLFGQYEKDILIFNNPRKMYIDGEFIDIYTEYFIKELHSDMYQVLENPYMNKHYKNRRKLNTRYLDALKLQAALSGFCKKVKLSKSDYKKISEIEWEIHQTFNCRIDLQSIFKRNITRFKVNFNYYKKIIQKRRPKIIFVVAHYSYHELIYAAKVNGIPVIELQHGVITPYSISYNYPQTNNSIDYFPDKILTFGEYWAESINFPIKKHNIIPVGYPFLEKQIEKYKFEKKDSKQILFLSQGTIGKKLFDVAIEFAKGLKDYKIVYKLHPGEFADWKLKYSDYSEVEQLDNLEIIDTNMKELYYYFSKSNYVVGVYSTALYEGLAFGCNCILVDLPGIDYMEKLISSGEVAVVKGSNDLAKFIVENSQKKANDDEYLFKKVDYKKIFKELIQECISN
jgi:UDP-N-acetylglucosamine:LPS N-acetylglucosamine transferase